MFKRLFDNNWFVAVVSLFFSLLLFVSVSNNNLSNRVVISSSASMDSSVTISNVPVALGETDEGTFVSGMPERVSVRLSGPRNIINQLTVDDFKVQTETLVGVSSGRRQIRFLVTGLPEKVTYQVTPDFFYGEVSTKETREEEISYQVSDTLADEGYQVGNITLSQTKVSLTGSSDEMQKIDRVQVNISSSRRHRETFTQTYRIQVLDKEGNPLDINLSQEEIEVTVEITASAAQTPINIVPVGELNGYTYQYRLINQTTVQVSGTGADQYTIANLLVDVSQLAASGIVTGYFESIEGLIFSPSSVEVQVTMASVNEEETSESSETITSEENSQNEETTSESES